ncbi:MAG: hypothetical protein GXP15_05085 [Gammaproteobacteria bacterium]|nr:hypothetical protein [Gammaproteobacteria bacterium]
MPKDRDQEETPREPAKIRIDDQGRSVWADAVETAQFELVSTQQLQTLLASDDIEGRRSIEAIATDNGDGVLVRDAATGLFEIIDDFDVQAILDEEQQRPRDATATASLATPSTDNAVPVEPLSLVSTQMLRKVLDTETKSDAKLKSDDGGGGGFDPYNSR